MSNIVIVAGLLLEVLDAGTKIANAIAKAQAEDRDISPAELATIKQDREDAWKRFDQAGPRDVASLP